MMTQTQVSLDSNLVESLRQIAAEKGKTLDQVFDDLAQQFLRAEREARLQREQAAYRILHPELKIKYLGESVAIYNSALIDHDADVMALVRRVRQRFGNAPVLFCEVEEEPERVYVIRSPRLERVE
ncbi:MAG: hypothetical protein L0Y55_01435 [Anaerolineales bacterium]|nr:hypothetical protein [Anaerolineales bacterium]